MIDDYVREEVWYREALALGLDRDDTIIRRRLRQKLEFLAEDVAAQAEPSDDDLRAYLQAHPEAFAVEPHVTFRQVYLDPRRHGAHLARDVDRLLAELQQISHTADPAELGDGVLLAHRFDHVSAAEVRTLFGDTFAAGVSTLTPGQWQGPVPSGYGVHLVYVSERTAGRIPELVEVREAVRRAWAQAQRLDARRDVLSDAPPALHRDHRASAGGAGDGAHTTDPEVRHEPLALVVLVLVLRRSGGVGARSPPGLSPAPADRGGHVRRALESAGTRRRSCGWVSTSNCRQIAPDSASHDRHSSTTPLPNAGA